MVSASPEAALDEAVQRDSVRALYHQIPQAVVVNLFIGLLFVLVLGRGIDRTLAWAWCAALWTAMAVGVLWWLGFRRVQQRADWDLARWRRRFFVTAGCVAACVGAGGWLFGAGAGSEAARQLVGVALLAIAAGSITSFAYHAPTMYAYIGFVLAPLWLQQLQPGAPEVWSTRVALPLFTLLIVSYARHQARLLRESLRVRHRSAALVEALREKTAALEQAHGAKAQFFAAASHDLRQPLHALGYYASLLQPHAGDAPHVERIEQCIGALDDLLEGVLDISRLDAGRVQARIGPVAVETLLRRIVSLYEGAAAAKGLKLSMRAPPDLWVRSDGDLLERVLTNLVSNALRYTDEGRVLLAARRGGGGVRLQVFDTGVGVPAEQHERIFDEFVQLGNAQRDPSQGVGLGLATVRRLCALLGHALTLRSAPGRGSCFELQLPLSDPPPPEVPAAAAQPAGAPLQGRVLVVEDHELVRESLLRTLGGWGLVCDGAADGDAALALAREQAYDAVLCDWRLPGALDGCALLEAIRPLQPRLALAALMTGEAESSLAAVPAGVQVLRKPLRPIRLRALLQSQLIPP